MNPFKTLSALSGKVVRPILRKLAGEAGEELRRTRELQRKVAVAAVAVARARAVEKIPGNTDHSANMSAWQAVMRGRTIKGRGER